MPESTSLAQSAPTPPAGSSLKKDLIAALGITLAFIVVHLGIMYFLIGDKTAPERLVSSLCSLLSAPVVFLAAWFGIASWYRANQATEPLRRRMRKWLFVHGVVAMIVSVPAGLVVFAVSGWTSSNIFNVAIQGSWARTWLPLNILSIFPAFVFWRDLWRGTLPNWARLLLLLVVLLFLAAVDIVSFLAPNWS